MKIIDLHNHTKYSYDGSHSPEEIIENAISFGMTVVGISDHQFSVREGLREYIDCIDSCKRIYRRHIRVLCGLEIGTRPKPDDFLASESGALDYCLFESLDSMNAMDFYEFEQWQKLFKCEKGFAHTDVFGLGERYGIDIFAFMKKYRIFWELNTSGNYAYYYDFLTNPKKRIIAATSGVYMSVGSDTHWLGEFDFGKIKRAQTIINDMGNKCIFG